MKLQFLYTDDSYKEKIHDIKLEDSVTLSHTNESNLFIFSYEVKGENSDVAEVLSSIKSQVLNVVDKDKCFLLTDGASEYYNKQLYPLYNQFERELRQVVCMCAVKKGDKTAKEFALNLEKLDFSEIKVRLFTNVSFYEKVKKILENSKSSKISKQDFIKEIETIPEYILWNRMFTKKFTYISDHFGQLQKFRNDIMHAHNISYEDYKSSKKLVQKANLELKRISEQILCDEIISPNISDVFAILEGISKFTQECVDPNSNLNKTLNLITSFFVNLAKENSNG